jgi:hypothetical protein
MTTSTADCKPGTEPLDAALGYAGLGWHVLPLHHITDKGVCSCKEGEKCGRSAGKHPRIGRWQHDASSDPVKVRGWWGKWPGANVGILTGPESGIFDLEVEEEGLADLAALEEANGALPRTPCAVSGHGGMHHVFRWPAGGLVVTTGSHVNKLPIDTRGRGGQFVAPPSRNLGGEYRWVVSPSDARPAEAPGWLLDWLRDNGRLEGGHGGNGRPNSSRFKVKDTKVLSVEERAVLYLRACPPAVSGQGGHAATFRAARAVVYGFDLGPERGLRLLLDHYNPRCVPEWSEQELRHKCADADSKEFKKPRGYLLGDTGHGTRGASSGARTAGGGGSSGTAGQQGDATSPSGPDWTEPIPLGELPAPPPFPTACLPGWLRVWVEETAEGTQTPADLPALLALAAAAAGLARKVRVRVREGWAEPVNLFVAAALLSGERKSVVFARALEPVKEYEQAEQERLAGEIAEAQSERRVLELSLKATEAKAAKARGEERKDLKAQAKELARELAEHVVPVPPQFFCDDATPEKLSNLLAEQGGRMLQASAEGTAFEIAKGRYSEAANFDVYLKGHSGDPLRVARVGRAGENVHQPALSVALAVQPEVIRGLAGQASMRGRGFLARFLYSLPASLVGRRKVAPAPASRDAARVYHEKMRVLWAMEGAVDEDGRPAPHWLHFSPEADRTLQEFERWLEPQLAPGEDLSLLAGWANKLAGACARVAAVLHVAGAVGAGKDWHNPVPAATVEAAIRLGRDYLLPHAQAAFALMGADERLEKARSVWCSIVRRFSESCEYSEDAPPSVSRRDLHQWNRRAFPGGVGELDPVLALLVDHDYLRPSPQQAGQPGRGHKSPVYQVNPFALAAEKRASRTHCPHRPHSDPPTGPGEASEDSESAPRPGRNETGQEYGDAWEGD